MLPDAADLPLLVADEDVEVAVGVEVEEADAVFAPLIVAQGASGEEILVDAVQRIRKGQELDPFAVGFVGVIDEVDDAIRGNPRVGMKHEGVDALLRNGVVERGFHVVECAQVVRSVEVVAFPIAGDGAGEFPEGIADDIGVGVVLDRVDEGVEGEVLAELLGIGLGDVED